MIRKILITLMLAGMFSAQAQVEVFEGFILDTLTTAQLNALPSKVKIKGAHFYNKDISSLVGWNGLAWVAIGSGTIADGSITEAKLNTTVNASLDLADTSVQPADLTNYVTTNTTQTITSPKTFSSGLTVSSGNAVVNFLGPVTTGANNIGNSSDYFNSINGKTIQMYTESTLGDLKIDHDATDWGFYFNTDATRGVFTKRYSLNPSGTPSAATDLISKSYFDANSGSGDPDQTLSLGGTGNKDLTILDGNTVDLTGVTGIDPDNIIGTVSGRTNVGNVTNFAEQSLADYNTDGTPSAGVKILIKDPLGMEEVTAGSSTIDWIDSDGYLIAKDLYLDNTTDDVESFTLQDQNIGYTVEIYLNQANEPTFTGSPTLVGGLDWTDDSLANTDVTVLVFRTGKGVRKAYRLGH